MTNPKKILVVGGGAAGFFVLRASASARRVMRKNPLGNAPQTKWAVNA